jgi:hypothetical protein
MPRTVPVPSRPDQQRADEYMDDQEPPDLKDGHAFDGEADEQQRAGHSSEAFVAFDSGHAVLATVPRCALCG